MFEEDVTISKQTFRFVLYPLRRIRGQQFCNMVLGMSHFLLETFPNMRMQYLQSNHESYFQIREGFGEEKKC